MDITSQIDVSDSEIIAIEKGPIAYAQRMQDKGSVDLEAFRRNLIDQFAEVGFKVKVKVWTTNQEGLFWFEPEIVGRLKTFDPDRMVHEVVNNILELPDQDKGWIKTDEGMKAAEIEVAERRKAHKRHGH